MTHIAYRAMTALYVCTFLVLAAHLALTGAVRITLEIQEAVE